MSDNGSLLFDEGAQARRRLRIAAAAAAGLALLLLGIGWPRGLDDHLLDAWISVRGQREPSSQVVVVAIDNKSIDAIGAYPWSRSKYVPLLDRLRQAGAKVVAFDVLLEPNPEQGLPAPGGIAGQAEDGSALSHNEALARAFEQAGNVVFASYFDDLGDPSPPGHEPPAWALRNSIANFDDGPLSLPRSPVIHQSEERLSEAAAALGHVNTVADRSDGSIRWLPSLVRHGDRVYPSLAVQAARLYQGIPLDSLRLEGSSLRLGYASIPLGSTGRVLLNWTGPEPSFPTYSFIDVVKGEVGERNFAGKLVFVAATATGLDEKQLPFRKNAPGVLIHATLAENILTVNFLSWPAWAWLLELGLAVALAALGALVFPRLSTGRLLTIGGAILVLLPLVALFLLVTRGTWLRVIHPLLAVALPLAATVAFRLRETERTVVDVEAQKREQQKLLGLSFQEKGMLDMAFATFQKLPLDDELKTIYRNLGVDLENRGQAEKAFLAYKRVFEADPGFEDIAGRLEALRRGGVGTRFFEASTQGLGGGTGALPTSTPAGFPTAPPGLTPTALTPEDGPPTAMLAPTAAASPAMARAAAPGGDLDSTRAVSGPATMPPTATPVAGRTFSRYEVLEKLGRGGMGDVFKVRDPKIGRIAAMKTVRMDVDVAPQQRIEMRQRFYREAQAAGKLTHPNIVTIYDIGEEQGMAFIVMEFVEGQTLTALARRLKNLTIAQIKHVITQSAQALHYAHENGVVHRDVKPDNIMVTGKGVVKLMDFGIARLVESDMTRTGTVLGTPSYMSPELFAGKKVDARSDIFSLGVVLYELLTGRRPFRGDTATALMSEVLRAEPEPPSQVQTGLDPAWDALIARALAKDPADRFQTAAELAEAVQKAPGKR